MTNDSIISWSVFFDDALFSAMAAIGFSSISHTPQRAYILCAVAAAAGHSLRFLLTMPGGTEMNIIAAATIAAFIVGVIAVFVAKVIKVPAEACLFPALLPMIPGLYACRAFEGFVGCLSNLDESLFSHNLYLFVSNGMTCGAIVIGMAIGANIPIFLMKKISFQVTR